MDGNYSLIVTVNGCSSAAGVTAVQINAAPATPAPSNNGPLCAGQTLNLSANVTADSYAWSGPGGYTSTAQNPTRTNVTTAMDGNYSLIVTVNGCSSAAGVTAVQINAAPATPAPSNNGPLCAGQTLNLSANVTADSYAWSGPGGYTSTSQNPTRTNVTTAMDGNYSLIVTVNGCSSAAGVTAVQVNAAPATPAPSNNGPLCAGQTLNLSANVTADSYAWSGPGGYTSTAQNPTRTNVTTAMDGNYSLIVTVNGCSSAAGVTAVQINAAPATPAPSNNGPLCAGQTLNLSANVTADSYAWSGPGGYTSTAQNPTRTNVTTAMDGNYSLIVTVNGCSSAAGVTAVQINAAPATPTPSNNGPLCEGQNLNLQANVTADSYSWTGPGGYASTAQNPTRNNVTTAMAGNYSLTVTINGCTSTAGVTNVQINTIPATPIANSNSPVCLGGTLNLTASNIAGATYSWTGPGGYTSSQQNPVRNGVTAGMAGTYSVTATVNGCTSAAGTTDVVLSAALNSGTINTTGGTFCVNWSATINSTGVATGGSGTLTYTWQQSIGCTGTWTDIGGTNTASYTPPNFPSPEHVLLSQNGHGWMREHCIYSIGSVYHSSRSCLAKCNRHSSHCNCLCRYQRFPQPSPVVVVVLLAYMSMSMNSARIVVPAGPLIRRGMRYLRQA
jgi:hypothetical protein